MSTYQACKPVETIGTPAALMLAEAVVILNIPGEFDIRSETWSDREFACASAKKHNEGM
jgi:hypothetical protein